MEPSVQVAIITAMGLIIVTALTVVGTVINSKLNAAAAATVKTDLQLREIHVLTNSNWAQTKAQLDTAVNKIASLETLINEMRNPSYKHQSLGGSATLPVPVTDEAAERVAVATEKLADVAQQTADKGDSK